MDQLGLRQRGGDGAGAAVPSEAEPFLTDATVNVTLRHAGNVITLSLDRK